MASLQFFPLYLQVILQIYLKALVQKGMHSYFHCLLLQANFCQTKVFWHKKHFSFTVKADFKKEPPHKKTEFLDKCYILNNEAHIIPENTEGPVVTGLICCK